MKPALIFLFKSRSKHLQCQNKRSIYTTVHVHILKHICPVTVIASAAFAFKCMCKVNETNMVQKYIESLFNQRASTNTIFRPLTREYQDGQDQNVY